MSLILPIFIFQSSFNSPEPQKLTKFSIPHQLWGKVPEEIKKLAVEDNKKVKVVNPQQHSTFGNPKPKPSSVLGKPNPKPHQVHLDDNYPSSDNPPQDVDKSCHLSDSAAPLIVWMNQVH